MNNTVA